ncbi:MAG: hemerythrin domain-containing protein [Myxococcaceae bacterium]
MNGPIFRFFVRDHTRLDGLLRHSVEGQGEVDRASFDAFRAGLLKHIAAEEKVLLPAAREANGGKPLAVAARLKLEHAVIAAILVLPPTRRWVETLRELLIAHNPLEEDPGGLYDLCEQLLGEGAEAMLEKARAVPDPKVAEYRDDPRVVRHVEEALAALRRSPRAG